MKTPKIILGPRFEPTEEADRQTPKLRQAGDWKLASKQDKDKRKRNLTDSTLKKKKKKERRKKKKSLLRAGFEPATYGFLSEQALHCANYSPPLYQLSYRREE